MKWMIFITAFSASCLLTAIVCRYAMAVGIIDNPNARSSHTIPTPRGGGLAIVITFVLGALILWSMGRADLNLMLALVGGGGLVALVGFMDDRGHVSVKVRMLVHLGAAIWAIYLLGGIPAIRVGQIWIHLGVFGDILGVTAIVWALNLFNFMDGVDGIAASEGVFVAGAGAAIGYLFGTAQSMPLLSLLLAASCLGFLVWNWPPARIFMGDVGSGFIGYVLAVLAVAEMHANAAGLFIWLVLGALFFVDATVTLVRRLLRGEPVYQAHRSHAYQWLARRWNSHRPVTVIVILINVFWLLPIACLGAVFTQSAWFLALIALVPVGIGAIVAGAGREE